MSWDRSKAGTSPPGSLFSSGRGERVAGGWNSQMEGRKGDEGCLDGEIANGVRDEESEVSRHTEDRTANRGETGGGVQMVE